MHVTTTDDSEKTLENGKNIENDDFNNVVTNGVKSNEDATKDNNEEDNGKLEIETITTNGVYEESTKESNVQEEVTNGNEMQGHKIEEENIVTKEEESDDKIEKNDKIDVITEKKNGEETKVDETIKNVEDVVATKNEIESKPIQLEITKEEQLLSVKEDDKVQNEITEETKEESVLMKKEESKQITIEDKVPKNGTKRRSDIMDMEADREGNTSGSDGEGYQDSKRIRFDESIFEEDERDRLIREFVEKSTDTMEDINKNCDKLHQDISRLSELARCKELEWNTIIRILKLKEEMLERIMFKRRQSELMKNGNELEADKLYKQFTEQAKGGRNGTSTPPSSTTSTMVPVVSSASPLPISCTDYPIYKPSLDAFCKNMKNQRPILPKPISSSIIDQNSIVGEGRQGPILDVKSIIADFRSKNPENIPKRGRRPPAFAKTMGMEAAQHGQPRFLTNTSLLSMANMALGSGSHVRTSVSSTSHDSPTSFLIGQESSITAAPRSDTLNRVINVDPMMMSSTSITASSHHLFQDALVKLSKRSERRDNQSPHPQNKQNLPPPPPYPEVTLHPVMVPQSSSSSAVHNSLLHGILTKANSQQCAGGNSSSNNNKNSNTNSNNGTSSSTIQHRPTTFSPTLARLLTDPERVRNSRLGGASSTTKANTKSAITEILNCKKARTEVTITPVASSSTCMKMNNNNDIVLLQDDDDDGETDRLVIDEGRDTLSDNVNNIIPADQVPECQGCHKKVAQFVCAGCGNQWYCSRECQVQAWEEHSEMCSG